MSIFILKYKVSDLILFFVLFFDEFGYVISIVLASKPYVVHQYIYVPECWYSYLNNVYILYMLYM